MRFASQSERKLLSSSQISERDKINAQWQVECVQSLAWCLGIVELDPFRGCDDDLAQHFPKPFTDPSEFFNTATLRPFEEIYQQADLHFRLHWAARNARLRGQNSKVNEEMIQERRKALDWVIGVDADWDEIPMDT